MTDSPAPTGDPADEHALAPAIRISDDDRSATIDRLQDAAGRGFLTIDELETRIDLAAAAKTRPDLTPLTADLPAPGTAVATLSPARVSATLSKTRREGYWQVPGRIEVAVSFGKIVLDFTQAELTTSAVEVNVTGFASSIDVIAPAGMRVDVSALATPLGKSEVRGTVSSSDGPLVRVTGRLTLGTLKARRLSATEGFFRSSFDG